MSKIGSKRVTTWRYEDKQQRVSFEVPVNMVDTAKQYHPDLSKPRTYFEVQLPDLQINEQDVNIDALRTRVFEAIHTRLTIEWRDMLLVSVAQRRDRLYKKGSKPTTGATGENGEVSLSIDWKRYQLAEVQRKKVHRAFSHWLPATTGDSGHAYWGMTLDDWPETGVEHRDRDAEVPETRTVLITDTPDHRRALEEVADALDALATKLGTLFGTDQATAVLGQIAKSGLAGIAQLGRMGRAMPGAAKEVAHGEEDKPV